MLKSSMQAFCQIDLPPFNFHPLIILSRPVLYESTSGNSGITRLRQTVLISCPYKLVLRVYNTATRKVEEFKSIEENKVGMYVCGLTVYNDMHLGMQGLTLLLMLFADGLNTVDMKLILFKIIQTLMTK